MKCPKFLDQRRLDFIRIELEAYLELGTHQGIVLVASLFVLKDIPHIIMSYASEGSLETWLSLRCGSDMNGQCFAPRMPSATNHLNRQIMRVLIYWQLYCLANALLLSLNALANFEMKYFAAICFIANST